MDNILVNFDNYKRAWSVQTELPVSFSVKYSSDVFNPSNHDLLDYGSSNRRFVVIDKAVNDLYGEEIENYFSSLKVELKLCVIDATEENKNWKNTDEVLKFFEEAGILRRAEPVIAIGGGVLLDLVGFCASIYRRGIPYVKVPTTLLAIVDASVGSKTGINHLERRNRLGSYYPPIASLIDKKFIKTQDQRHIVNGLAEIYKLALIKDASLFELLEVNYDQLIDEKFQFGAVPVRVINLAITGMIDELAPNLWEKKLDRCVDFGHSFSPLIEMKNLPELYHGEAVAMDCLLSSCLAHNRQYLNENDLMRVFKTAKNLRLPTYHKDFTDMEILTQALGDTSKHRNNNQYLPVPVSIGNYRILNDVAIEEIEAAAKLYDEICNQKLANV